jgi:hypothetical protein
MSAGCAVSGNALPPGVVEGCAISSNDTFAAAAVKSTGDQQHGRSGQLRR